MGISISTKCSPLLVDLFLFFYEKDCKLCLSEVNHANDTGGFTITGLVINSVYPDLGLHCLLRLVSPNI